jgi:hypothetical protein
MTNIGFIIVSCLLAQMIVRADAKVRRDVGVWLVTGLIFIIGIGSGLFHTFATRWALIVDVVPIMLFILIYTWYAVRRFVGASTLICALAVTTVLSVALAVPALTGFRGGSYVAALLALIVIGSYLRFVRKHPAGRFLLLASAVFAASLTLRTVDESICFSFPTGTHFLWHLLNAAVLFIVANALVKYCERPRQRD